MSFRIWSWMVTSSAVVGSSAIRSLRPAGQRHGDHHPLAHAAGELVRPGLHPLSGRRHAHPVEQADGFALSALRRRKPLMAPDRFLDLPADPHGRVERGHRVLEDHGDAAAADRSDLAVVEQRRGRGPRKGSPPRTMRARRAAEQANDRPTGGTLAATRSRRPGRTSRRAGSRTTRSSTAVTRPGAGTEDRHQVADAEQRLAHQPLGRNSVSRPSPRSVKAMPA